MPLVAENSRIVNVGPVDEPSIRTTHTAVTTPTFRGDGDWTSGIVQAQLEPQPQWNTQGARLGAPAGPGTDDSLLRPLEPAVPYAGITAKSDYISYLGSPSRICMAVSDFVQMIVDVDQFIARRVFVLHNNRSGSEESVSLHYHWGNATEIAIEDYSLIQSFESDTAEALACALIDPAAETSTLLTFFQTADGEVYCKPVTVAPESRNDMSWPKEGNEGTRYPVVHPCLSVGAPVHIASGGRAGVRTGWTALGFEGGDIYFSSLQAVTLDDERVLLLHLQSDGTINARTVTADGTASAPVVVGAGATNLYQVVGANHGHTSEDRNTVVFTYRFGATESKVVTLNCDGDPVITGEATISADYTHPAWCRDRIVVLAKVAYGAGGSTVGFGDSPVVLHVYTDQLVHLNAVPGDSGNTLQLQQVGTVHGFSDGRLFMHCSSFEDNTDIQIGHTYEMLNSGIRLFVLAGDDLVLQDKIAQVDYQCVSTHAVRWGPDMVFLVGPTGETYGGPPGDEQAYISAHYVSGVLKEGTSDVQPYRISDDWLIVTEPESNGFWWTAPGVNTATTKEVNSINVRAIHLDNEAVPDRAGEPVALYQMGSRYSAACRVTDTRFLHIGSGLTDTVAAILSASLYSSPRSFYFQVVDIDETTGDLTIIHETKDHPLIADAAVIFHMVQIGASNRYMLLFTIPTVIEGGVVTESDLYVRTFELHDDFTTTTLDTQQVDLNPSGGPFTERKPYEICAITDTKFVITWIRDNNEFQHWSAHRGVVVDGNGNMTMGNILGVDPNSGDDGIYGFQGTWMHKGCAVDGRYVYPVADEWPATADDGRYPPYQIIQSGEYTIRFFQKVPFALMVLDIDSSANLTPSWYPCRVDADAVDLDWYEANEFFAPGPQRTSPDAGRIYQAHPDGGVYYTWETCQAHRGTARGEVWLFQGPSPIPWLLAGVSDAMQMHLWHLDDREQVAWYRGESWGQFGIPYYVSYMNGSVEMRRGIIACVSTLDYYSRAAPQGWNAGFGSNLLRIWSAGTARGTAVAGPQDIRVSSEGKDFR